MHEQVKLKVEEYKKAIDAAKSAKAEQQSMEFEQQKKNFLRREGLLYAPSSERKQCNPTTPGAKAVWNPELKKHEYYSFMTQIEVSDEEYEELKRLKAELEEESAKRNEYKKPSSVKALPKSIDIDTFLASNSDNYNTANKLKSVANGIKTIGIIVTLIATVVGIIEIFADLDNAWVGILVCVGSWVNFFAFYMAYLLLSALAEITHSTQRSADILYFTAKKEEQKEDKTEE
ncbi:MAG: hypothetical protein IJB76_00125 [Clostridia bacterium]|nr:hypothetical protein [Clostridia bacterium]